MDDTDDLDLRTLSATVITSAGPQQAERIRATAEEWLTDGTEAANDDRLVAYQTFARLGDAGRVIDALWDPAPSVIIDICQRITPALLTQLDGDATRRLADRLGYLSGNPMSRIASAALFTIGRCRLRGCADQVLDAIDDDVPAVAGAALEAAGSLGLDVEDAAREALASDEPRLLRGGLRFASQTADPALAGFVADAVLRLVAMPHRRNRGVRGAVMAALRAYPPHSLQITGDLLPALTTAGTRTVVAEMLRHTAPSPAAVGRLTNLRRDPSDKLRRQVMLALLHHDPDQATAHLTGMIADADEPIRIDAWDTITRTPTSAPAGASALAESAARAGSTHERAAALRAAAALGADRSLLADLYHDPNDTVAATARELWGQQDPPPPPDPNPTGATGRELLARLLRTDPALDQQGTHAVLTAYDRATRR